MEQGLGTGQAGEAQLGKEFVLKGLKKGVEKDLSASLRNSGKSFPEGECLGQEEWKVTGAVRAGVWGFDGIRLESYLLI